MKLRYLLFLAIAFAVASCSSSYKSSQTPDDVYFSPEPEPSTYVTVVSQQDEESYSYRNDDEEREIRRGIRDPRYRTSLNLYLGNAYGFNYYNDPFYNPFYNNYYPNFLWGPNPYLAGNYSVHFSPYFNRFGNGYYMGNYYNPYAGYGGPYWNSGYYGYYSHGGYGNYYYPTGRIVKDNGPRMSNLNGLGRNTVEPRRISSDKKEPNIAPVRTMRQPSNSNTGLGNTIRKVFKPTEKRSAPSSSDNQRRYTPSQQPTRTFTPKNDPAPSRTIERSSPSNNNSGGGSAPIRKF